MGIQTEWHTPEETILHLSESKVEDFEMVRLRNNHSVTKCQENSVIKTLREGNESSNMATIDVTAKRVLLTCLCSLGGTPCPKELSIAQSLYFLSISLLYVASYVLVCIFNCAIIILVNRSVHYRVTCLMEYVTPNLKQLQAREQNLLTRTLLCITFLQVATNLVYIGSISHLARLFYGRDFIESPSYKVHSLVSNVMIVLQCSANFLLFAFINRKFQLEFCRLLKNLRVSKKTVVFKRDTKRIRTVSSRVSTSSEEGWFSNALYKA